MQDVIETVLNTHADLLAGGNVDGAAELARMLGRHDVVGLLGVARAAQDALPRVRPTAAFRDALRRDLAAAPGQWGSRWRAHRAGRGWRVKRPGRPWRLAVRRPAWGLVPRRAAWELAPWVPGPRGTVRWLRRHARSATAVSGSAAAAAAGAAFALWLRRRSSHLR